MKLTALPAFAGDDTFHVVVETPRGSALKLKYEEQWEAIGVSRPLPIGLTLPFDWGFVPSTRNADGDPLDAMLLWDVPSYPGVVVKCRAIAVLQVEQNRTNHDSSQRIRNDRVMCVPIEARREQTFTDLGALPERLRRELEQFAVSAAALEGKAVQVVGWEDATVALELVRAAASDCPAS